MHPRDPGAVLSKVAVLCLISMLHKLVLKSQCPNLKYTAINILEEIEH